MSAWFVLNAMGFYSFCPGDPTYSLGRPLFDEVAITVGNGKEFTVRAINNGPKRMFIQEANLNGTPLKAPFFSHEQLLQGGLLELKMGAAPNTRCLVNDSD